MSTKNIYKRRERKEELPNKNRKFQKVIDDVETQGSYTDFVCSSQETGNSNHKRFHLHFIPFITLIQKIVVSVKYTGY